MKYRNIDRNFRSTVTVAYIYKRKCRVEVTSVGLAHARPIMCLAKYTPSPVKREA